MSWAMIMRDLTVELHDDLRHARGADRLAAAARAVHTAREALEAHVGDDVQAVRELLSAIEAAHREVGP
jgi:chemotaxis regulatin CheY-phosphate phosphatase CheZ